MGDENQVLMGDFLCTVDRLLQRLSKIVSGLVVVVSVPGIFIRIVLGRPFVILVHRGITESRIYYHQILNSNELVRGNR